METNTSFTTVTTSGSATSKTTASSSGTSSASALTSDFETFLRLLTAQLQNQDPLNPAESTEFVAQLASFSAVEQQIRTNDTLSQIFETIGGSSLDGLAQWIGKEVRAPVKANFDGTPIDVTFTPQDKADRAVVVVSNDFGDVVARFSVQPAKGDTTWDGQNVSGEQSANGRYSFAVESYEGATLLNTQDAQVYTRVAEVRLVDGAPILVLQEGEQVAPSSVTALR